MYEEMATGALLSFVATARGLGAIERARAIERTAAATGLTDSAGAADRDAVPGGTGSAWASRRR